MFKRQLESGEWSRSLNSQKVEKNKNPTFPEIVTNSKILSMCNWDVALNIEIVDHKSNGDEKFKCKTANFNMNQFVESCKIP